jgi:hypothetical protein
MRPTARTTGPTRWTSVPSRCATRCFRASSTACSACCSAWASRSSSRACRPTRSAGHRLYLRRLLVLLAARRGACLGVLDRRRAAHLRHPRPASWCCSLRRASATAPDPLMAGCIVYPLLAGLLRVVFVSPRFTASACRHCARPLRPPTTPPTAAAASSTPCAKTCAPWPSSTATGYGLWGTFGWYVAMTLTMLLGVLAGRRRWAQRMPELMPQIRRLDLVGCWCSGWRCGGHRHRDLRAQPHTRPVA